MADTALAKAPVAPRHGRAGAGTRGTGSRGAGAYLTYLVPAAVLFTVVIAVPVNLIDVADAATGALRRLASAPA